MVTERVGSLGFTNGPNLNYTVRRVLVHSLYLYLLLPPPIIISKFVVRLVLSQFR